MAIRRRRSSLSRQWPRSWSALSAVAIGLILGCTATAAEADSLQPGPYAPYAFLIGEWNVGPENAQAAFVARFRWGPNQSYIWHSVSLLRDGTEVPHFEGMLVWNAAHRNLDMLLALGLSGGGAQEQGTVSIDSDGAVVRNITAYGSDGARAHFRQTFKSIGPDTIVTSVMRETREGWVASFPGSERLLMKRRSAE